MKRVTLFICNLLLLATTAFNGCENSKEKPVLNDKGVIELTTAKQYVHFRIEFDTMTIDWGDGKTNSYSSTGDEDEPLLITHYYDEWRLHTTRIHAEKLTLLNCSGNQLTALDVSRNTALISWGCEYNLLSTKALNNLLSGLPVSSAKSGKIKIRGNPGSSICDRALATDKGWIVKD